MKPLAKVCSTYGAIAGLLSTALLIGYYYMGDHPLLIPVFLDFRILLFAIFIFFALKEFRDLHQQGLLYFWQGILGSLVFVAVFASISAVLLSAFGASVPNFVATYIAQKTAELQSFPPDIIERIGKEVYERNLKLLPATNAIDLGLIYLWQSFAIGFFISIILSVALRRLPKP